MGTETWWRFVTEVAGLLKDGEDDGEGSEFTWENDDAWATLHQLIDTARDIVARNKAIADSERREAEYWRRINP